ncbi:MAG: protein translocase subunit SecF [bacterium]
MFDIIQKRKIWLSFSGFLVAVSVLAILVWGLKLGIDFTGGSLLEVKFNTDRPANSDIEEAVRDLDLGSLIVQSVGEDGVILRFQNTSQEKHQKTLEKLEELVQKNNTENLEDESATATGTESVDIDLDIVAGSGTTTAVIIQTDFENKLVEELRYDSVGGTIGQELKTKSLNAIIVVLIFIMLFIAWSFRKVSKPVASWKYGLAAIIALVHDVTITIGIFAVLGRFLNIEINTPFVAAILTVLGYSVMDTIVVFDRIRENLPKSDDSFEETVNTSVNQIIRRSINTSMTTLICLLSIFIFGGESIRSFVLALIIGVFFGAYSSIFLASPILAVCNKLSRI